MKIALSARQLSLGLIALASVGLLRWLAVAPTPPLYAQTSPLATRSAETSASSVEPLTTKPTASKLVLPIGGLWLSLSNG